MPFETRENIPNTYTNKEKDRHKENRELINPNLIAKKLIIFDFLKGGLSLDNENFKEIQKDLENIKTKNKKEEELKTTLTQILNLLTVERDLGPKHYFEMIKPILHSPVLNQKDKNIFVEWLKNNFIGFLAEKVKNDTEPWYNTEALKEEGLPIPETKKYHYISAPGKGAKLVELLKKEFSQYDWNNRALVAELERE